MAIDWNSVKAALVAWFEAGSGLDDAHVIWIYQNAPRLPSPPFATINPRVALARVGIYDEERIDDEVDGQIDRIGQRRITVSCNTYGPDAFALMEQAQEALDTYAAREALDAAGLAVSDRGSVKDFTKFLETQYEERAQLDVIFALATQTTEQVGAMAQASITTTLTGGQQPETFTITAP